MKMSRLRDQSVHTEAIGEGERAFRDTRKRRITKERQRRKVEKESKGT